MAGSRRSSGYLLRWLYASQADKDLDRDLASVEDRLDALEDGGGSGAAVVVTHGSNPDVPRPAGAQLVIWEGTVAPNQAAGTDFWRVP